MAVTADILRRLGKLRLDPEAFEEVLSIIADLQSVDEARRSGQRERTARHRALQRDCNVTETSPQRDPPPKIYNSTPHQALPTDPNGSVAPTPRKARKRAFPNDFEPNETCDAVRQELGRSVKWMDGCVTDLRTWALGKGEVRADWDMTLQGWMRREVKREGERGGQNHPRGSPGGGYANGRQPSAQERAFERARLADLEMREDRHDQDPSDADAEGHFGASRPQNGHARSDLHEPLGGRLRLAPPSLGFPPRAH